MGHSARVESFNSYLDLLRVVQIHNSTLNPLHLRRTPMKVVHVAYSDHLHNLVEEILTE